MEKDIHLSELNEDGFANPYACYDDCKPVSYYQNEQISNTNIEPGISYNNDYQAKDPEEAVGWFYKIHTFFIKVAENTKKCRVIRCIGGFMFLFFLFYGIFIVLIPYIKYSQMKSDSNDEFLTVPSYIIGAHWGFIILSCLVSLFFFFYYEINHCICPSCDRKWIFVIIPYLAIYVFYTVMIATSDFFKFGEILESPSYLLRCWESL